MGNLKKFAEVNTDIESKGDVTFVITAANEQRLRALCKYSEMLDYIVNADEKASVDGLINSLLEQAMIKRINELYKRHGFDSANDFIERIESCADGEEVRSEVVEAEAVSYKRAHDEILSHVPVPSDQMELPFEVAR